MNEPALTKQLAGGNTSAPCPGSARTPCEILCEWAWTKVNLRALQAAPETDADAINSARVAYRRALRLKRKLDEAYAFHHELLVEFTPQVPNARLERPGVNDQQP